MKNARDFSLIKKGQWTLHFLLLMFFVVYGITESQAQSCCPIFQLKDAVEICPPEGACKSGTAANGHGLTACKNTVHQYTVYPNLPGYTVVWTVTGGTPSPFTGNPINILWGSGASGFIKVVISNTASGGVCRDSILQEICLIDGPKAGFTASPLTVCTGSPVHFINTSLGGASYLWDFGDGTTSNLANPPDHSYATAGSYTVTLTVSNANGGGSSPGGDQRPPCGCIDVVTKVITVVTGTGPNIVTNCCYRTACPGDTSEFCTTVVCPTFNWSVTGGVIISGAGTSCIKVKWNTVYTVPTTVSLATPACTAAPCASTTTINVPVLYPNLPITGPNPICVGSSGTFFIPSMPGTYYLWSTTAPAGTFTFNDKNKNVANVNITFNAAGTYQVQCQYQNPLSGCNGLSTFTVNVLPVFSFLGDEKVCQGTTTTYYANGTATWAVTPAGATVAGGLTSTPNITWNIPGTFTIIGTASPTGIFCNLTAVKVVEVVAKPILGSIVGPSLVCPGKNLIYSITSNTQGSDFVWSVTGGGSVLSNMGNDKDSAVVKLTGTGPWTINVFQQIELSPGVYCQSVTKTMSVTGYPAPVITGPTTVCIDAVNVYTVSGGLPPGGIQWSVSPVNRGSITSGQGSNSVSIQWHGPPTVATITASNCSGGGILNVNIISAPVVAPISCSGATQYCLPTMPNNLTLSTTSGFPSYQWKLNGTTISGATNSSYLIPNATFSIAGGIYYFSVDVSNGACTTTQTMYILIGNCSGGGNPPNPVVCSIDFTMSPSPACVNQPVTFTALPTGPGFTYAWNFGDGATSFMSPTEHTYTSAGSYTVTLTATLGTCTAVKTHVMIINPTPTCSISAPDTAFCPGGSLLLTACGGMSSYQWYREGSPVSGATSSTFNATKYGDHYVVVTNGFGCSQKSNSLYLYIKNKPKAKITGDGYLCSSPGGLAQFPLSAYYNANYIYNWTTNAPGATFTPNNSNPAYYTNVSFTLPVVLPVTYSFVVQVFDPTTGCSNFDTLCVSFYETPQLSFASFYAACQAGPVTLTPTPVNPVKYNYHWSTGQTTPVITVKNAGTYALTITDKSTGCSASATAAMIYPKPDVSLFPHGCRTIRCKTDSIQMYIPLPLTWLPPYNTYPVAYPSIKWYDNGNYATPIAIGQNFTFLPTSGGTHQFSVVVQNNYGCTDTAGVYCLTVNCDTLDFGDAPDSPVNAGFSYATLLANNGARHVVVPGIRLGLKEDTEPNGQPSIGADCDDNDCLYASAGDDEDGVTIPNVVERGSIVNIQVFPTVTGFLDAWVDFNVNGNWSNAGEHIFINQPVTPPMTALSFIVPPTATIGQSYARFRFRTSGTSISYTGLVNDGEVEDYPVYIDDCSQGDQLDFGDAPDIPGTGFNYPTLLSNNGARHVMYINIRLGALIDAETNGQPNMTATGDNINLTNDEDGVAFLGTMYVGKPANINVTASVPGYLNAWMDFNKNGSWADAGDQIFTNKPLTAGLNALTFNIPATAIFGKTYLRFRFNTIGGLSYTGLATNGEVEDYQQQTCPYWSPNPTGIKHMIIVPSTLPNMTPGDVLGVFYTDNNGPQACAGLVEWNGTDTQVMVAYGDNPTTTTVKEGFVVGEPLVWKLCSRVKGDANPISVTYDQSYPNYNGLFVAGGFSALTNTTGLHVTVTATPSHVCPQQSVQLNAVPQESTSGITYSWTSQPAGFFSSAQSPVANPSVSTTYYVDAFDGVFHATSSVSVIVTDVNTPTDLLPLTNVIIPSGVYKCYNAYMKITTAGNSTTFTVQSGANVQLIAGQTVSLLPGTKVLSGGYLDARTTSTGSFCCTSGAAAPVSAEGTGIFDLTDNSKSFFSVFPNPTAGTFTLALTNVAATEKVTVEIYSILGDKIERVEYYGMPEHVFDLSGRAPGIYLVHVKYGDKTGITKVIRQQ